MKKYINTSNYYLSTIASKIEATGTSWTFDITDTSVDWVQLPTQWYYWVDVDFWDVSKREIFRIKSRNWYTLTYDARISPYGMKAHAIWATVWLRDFSQLLNSLSTNTDNFWEVEQTADLQIKVRWGKVISTGNEKMIFTVWDATIDIPINSEIYIVLDYELSNDWIELAAFASVVEELLTTTGKYPIAKITSNTTSIVEIEDLRANVIYGWGEWDMKASKYDPHNKQADVYAMDNMDQWEHNQYVSPTEKTYWWWKQPLLVSWENIVTINGKSIIDISQWEWGNIPLDTVLTVWWHTYTTEDWASSFTFTSPYLPLTSDSFIVFSDSGTLLTQWWQAPNDYTYNEETYTITFNESLAENEHAIIWLMYNNTESSIWVGSWVVTLTNWGEIIDSFNVNQDLNQAIDLWWIANNATITINQWLWQIWQFTTNQQCDSSINIKWDILVTSQEYSDLPDSKLTDWNFYYIYS